MPRRNFAVERLSVGDHPTSLVSEGPISRRLWDRLVDEHSQPGKTLTVACDIVKGRASIGVASIREDGRIHAGLVASNLQVEGVGPDDPGFFKVLAELCATHATDDVVRIDGKVVWESVLELMESVSYSRVREYSTEEMTSACERFVNLCNEDRIRHVGSETMADVIKGAKVREVGDSFMWSRRHSAGDVAPLIAVTLAAAAAADGITDADKIWIF